MGVHRYAVIGLGMFGKAIAVSLAKRGAEVLAIDIQEAQVEAIKDDVAHAIIMNACDKKALTSQGITEVDAVVVAIGENFEASLLTIAYLKELNIKRIIARANGEQQRMILELMGVTEILSPEDQVGIAVAEMLINPSIMSSLSLPNGFEIAEIKAPKAIVNRTLEEIGLKKKYNLQLITVQREYEVEEHNEKKTEKRVLGVPAGDTVIDTSDTLMVFGLQHDIEKFIDIN